MSRLKLNIHRIKVVFGIFKRFKAWMPYVQSWENPMHSTLVITAISSAAFFPNVVIPMALLYLVVRVPPRQPIPRTHPSNPGVHPVHARRSAHGPP